MPTLFQQARAKSEDLAGLGSQQAEKAKQMELLCARAGYERQQDRRLTAGLYMQRAPESRALMAACLLTALRDKEKDL